MTADIREKSALALGQLSPNIRSGILIGRNQKVTNSSADIWDANGIYQFLFAEEALEVISSGGDTFGGSGAQKLSVFGLDGLGNEKQITVDLNGGTVPLGDFMRVNNALVILSGSSQWNENDITVRTVAGGIIQAQILANRAFTQQFIYTVPKGYSFIIQGKMFYGCTVNDSGHSDGNVVKLLFQSQDFNTHTIATLAEFYANDTNSTQEIEPFLSVTPQGANSSAFPELTILKMSAVCNSGQAMIVTCGLIFTLTKNGIKFDPDSFPLAI